MPEFAIDIARVSNECLAAVLFTILTLLVLKVKREGLSLTLAVSIGVTLGLGLLAKAYFLTGIPAVALLLCEFRRASWRIAALSCITLAISSWWYIRNLATTGSLSGLSIPALEFGIPKCSHTLIESRTARSGVSALYWFCREPDENVGRRSHNESRKLDVELGLD